MMDNTFKVDYPVVMRGKWSELGGCSYSLEIFPMKIWGASWSYFEFTTI